MDELRQQIDRLTRRMDRERRARQEAESIAERVTGELYSTVTELKRVNDELNNVNQSMKEFVAIAAHDLRGPLTSILGFTEMMRRSADRLREDQRREFLEVIQRQGLQLKALVEDLLTLSRIEAGAMESHVEELLIARELHRTVVDLGSDANGVNVRAPDDLVVRADPSHLQRILVNYIANAQKYGAPPIEAEAGGEGSWVLVRVRDHGDGVPESFVGRLFGKFARADTEGANAQKGTGLGLSIVRGLARANGGDAWYEPNVPHGACFAVRLPKAG